MKNSLKFCTLSILTLTLIISCKASKVNVSSGSDIITKILYSGNLEEERELTIYLPKGYKSEFDLPVVYSADGQIITSAYKEVLDSLIDNAIVPKFILVGVHSNEKTVENSDVILRNYEYIKDWSEESEDKLLSKLYNRHLKFFTIEVLQYTEENFPVSKNSKDRVFYGCSNGAGFGISMSVDKPQLFDNYLLMSMGGGNYENINWPHEEYPNVVISYGKDEPLPFRMASDTYHEFLNSKNYKHSFYQYDGGHDRK